MSKRNIALLLTCFGSFAYGADQQGASEGLKSVTHMSGTCVCRREYHDGTYDSFCNPACTQCQTKAAELKNALKQTQKSVEK